VRQALVRANPVNGRKTVYIGAHASHIEGMPVDEGRAILKDLLEIATRPENVYQHRWRQHDLVIWDNRCLLHRGRLWDAKRYTRIMHRTTVAGDGPTA
jgi:alpha-ketoglutarate-dependent 2,4-dichlorophenoxyacetate dioxygenase